MFNGIHKLTHRRTGEAADRQPLLPPGKDPTQASSSTHGHQALAGRGSAGQATHAGALPPRRPLLGRSDAMSSGTQAIAQAAVPKPQVRFRPEASVVFADERPKAHAPVDFGPKAKPRPLRAAGPSNAATEPPRTAERPTAGPPKAAQPHEPKRGLFGGLFRSQGHQVDPGAGSSSSPPAAVPPHLRPELTQGQKFSRRLTEFMDHCPDEGLKARISQHAVQGNLDRVQQEIQKALASHGGGDQRSFELLQLMNGSIRKMGGDYSDVRINIRKSKG